MNKTRKLLLGTGVALLSIALLFTGGVVSKYVNERAADAPVQSAEFYFESNYLTEDNHEYKLNSGTEKIVIELYNFENELRISKVDCEYTVKVNGIEVKKLEAPQSNLPSTRSYELQVEAGKTYSVIVEANGGYKKTLSATFVVAKAADGFYMNVSDKGEYVLLTVWTENLSGTVSIDFPAGLIPDATDPRMKEVYNYSEGMYVSGQLEDKVSFVKSFSSHSYRFFKASNFNSSKFNVTIADINGSTRQATDANIP